MTIASELTKLNTNLTNAYTAVDGKGGTLPSAQNFDNLATAISSIPSGGDFNLTRFKDDNGNEIGTYYFDFEDGSGNKFKVICLDAQYRLASGKYLSDTTAITNLPMYANWFSSFWYTPNETATENCNLILNYCAAQGKTSTGVSHCRSKSFVINGTTYYGQLPNSRELWEILRRYKEINDLDITKASYPSTNFSSVKNLWSSTQYDTTGGWCINYLGYIYGNRKTADYTVCPVLEIPY